MYEAYFGLATLPFCIAPDSRFYVDAAPHRAAIRALQHRFGHGAEFVPLVGEAGAGKTTVGRRMLEEIDRTRQVAAELPCMRISGDQLFDRVAEALGMRRAGGVPPLGSVIRQLEHLVRDGRDALLLVDETHQLDVSALRRLRKLTAVRVEGRAALRVCLVGCSTPPCIEELQRIGRPLNIGAPVHVEALDTAGTHEYILERLRRAGWTGRPAFECTTAAIHERCKGNPGRVNRLCGHILLQLYIHGRDDVNADVVRAVDELLQAELSGKPATLALPPLARASPGAGVVTAASAPPRPAAPASKPVERA
jgi:type II secretory pathway predicted ATPase ExeA